MSTTSSLSSFLLLLLLFTLTIAVSCFNHNSSPNSPRDLLFEEKTRLGSMPPSCHNKCNQCHPCMAVQVPTLPRQERLRPGHMEFVEPSLLTNKYSNYKPLGWKCRCNGHFFNP
ncbi:hypothetical protein Dsin_015995 [Dipteronia sinensis]|uniref:Epidermal patterning factor-like protein n=1 Tax=Dipteronia sinensis TaxID=43782 RepID=A0AAE0ACK6_9ROSI|nr:hypothetical protein Dsin_015995 [Dipteronia sinensis]